jgi:hypothetical protein
MGSAGIGLAEGAHLKGKHIGFNAPGSAVAVINDIVAETANVPARALTMLGQCLDLVCS